MQPKTWKLSKAGELDLVKTFECGQCFRWNADDKGVYYGVAYGHCAKLWQDGEDIFICSDAPAELWHEYFDLDRNYDSISRDFYDGGYLQQCTQYGMGIRILRQEPWEALCSFIISQCNNIKRIKGIVERLCESYGERLEFDGRVFYSFPAPEKLLGLRAEDLSMLRCGYRAEYILVAAEAVATGELELDSLIRADWVEAKKKLMQLKGIGEKVANCVVLFGLYHMEAFPIDVWIKRALKQHFSADFRPESLGKYAGLAQQYIFYYARSQEV